jgi:hypothetical protein
MQENQNTSAGARGAPDWRPAKGEPDWVFNLYQSSVWPGFIRRAFDLHPLELKDQRFPPGSEIMVEPPPRTPQAGG